MATNTFYIGPILVSIHPRGAGLNAASDFDGVEAFWEKREDFEKNEKT